MVGTLDPGNVPLYTYTVGTDTYWAKVQCIYGVMRCNYSKRTMY